MWTSKAERFRHCWVYSATEFAGMSQLHWKLVVPRSLEVFDFFSCGLHWFFWIHCSGFNSVNSLDSIRCLQFGGFDLVESSRIQWLDVVLSAIMQSQNCNLVLLDSNGTISPTHQLFTSCSQFFVIGAICSRSPSLQFSIFPTGCACQSSAVDELK